MDSYWPDEGDEILHAVITVNTERVEALGDGDKWGIAYINDGLLG